VPALQQTHSGSIDGTSRGWVDGVETDGSTLFADSRLTPRAKRQIGEGELRWVSSSFRRDFRLTGEPDGPLLAGPYLHHVALLGDEPPAVKGLVDLTELRFSEGKASEEEEYVLFNEETGEVTYFAEVSTAKPEEELMPADMEQRLRDLESRFSETVRGLEERNRDLESKFGDEKRKREEVEARLRERDESEKTARFSSYRAELGRTVETLQNGKKLGAEGAKALQALGEAVYGSEAGEARFADYVATLKPITPPVLGEGRGDQDEDTESEYGITKADFADTMSSPDKIARVNRALSAYQAANPKASMGEATRALRQLVGAE
jgi:phage I-like protein